MVALIFIVGFIEAIAMVAWLFINSQKRRSEVSATLEKIRDYLVKAEETRSKFESLLSDMVGIDIIRAKAKELRSLQESLKVERGRITITQAELETVENRLRELEEIERELEASGLETKEELKILERKEKELRDKNGQLKDRIRQSTSALDKLMGEIEMSVQMQEQIQMMKTELLHTQQQIDTLLLQCEEGNEQYVILKRRYDALDIEYAQLYEKFAEVEVPAESEN